MSLEIPNNLLILERRKNTMPDDDTIMSNG